MASSCKTVVRRDAGPAPALYRLIADGALSRAALDACACPLALLDASTSPARILRVNVAFTLLFGHGDAVARGSTLAALVFDGDEARASRLLESPPGAAVRRTVQALHASGAGRIVEAAAAPVRGADGAIAQWVVSFFDCSELAALRDELARLRARAA